MTAPVPPDANGLREAVERASRVFGWQHLVKYAGQSDEWMDRTLTGIVLAADEQAAPTAGEREWGVRFPSGAVESMGSDEERARKFALATGNLRPDLPTLVVRRIVTDWEVTS